MAMDVPVRPRESPDGAQRHEPSHEVLRLELDGLRERLAQAPVIEQAKGLLMGRYAVDADTAFEMIRRWSMSENRKVRDICASLVEAAGATRTHADGVTWDEVRHQLRRG